MNAEQVETTFWGQLAEVSSRWDLLGHPFYVRWSTGHLTRRELSVYAAEYYHAVRALAKLVMSAARGASGPERSQLQAHADEELLHVDLWADFAAALPAVESSPHPVDETLECVEAWTSPPKSSLLHSLVAMYAIESGQSRVAATKRATLPLYGLDGPECTYFDVHAELDLEHAASTRALIEPRLADVEWEPLLAQAEAVLAANWKLLDGVERRNGILTIDLEGGITEPSVQALL
ncbi:MAG: iron-containing redox enzyme family protein [Actinomycetota bacterium]